MAIMIKVVNTHLEAMISQPGAKIAGDEVGTLGDKVEARPEAILHF